MKKILLILIIFFSFTGNTLAYSSFYFGHCTWYVAKSMDVSWRGNAKDWLYNAERVGREIGNIPKKKSIIVFNGKGYNEKYGHVGIVEVVLDDYIIISEMNYIGLGIKNFRKINKYNGSIVGYIY